MGTYDKPINWKPDQLTTLVKPTEEYPGKVAWSAVGLVNIEFAREFAFDLLKKCDLIEEMRKCL